MTHRVQLELHEDDLSFTATVFHDGQVARLGANKMQTEDGRQLAALDELFEAIRNAVGAKAFPRDTFRFRREDNTAGSKLIVDGFADGGSLPEALSVVK